MRISPQTRKDLQVISAIIVIGTLVGVAFSSVATGSVSVLTVVLGGSVGFLISFLCVLGQFSFLRRLRRLPFTAYLLLKAAYFTLVTVGVVAARLFLLGDISGPLPGTRKVLLVSTLLTLVISLLITLFLMLRRVIGPATFSHLITGRYFRPREEDRTFMILDIAASTAIAEMIGHRRFHNLLDEFFSDMAGPVLASGGDIYKYVGDGVIVTWNDRDKTVPGSCISCFFDIVSMVKEKREDYSRRFDFVPHCRAGMHLGTVTVGEMGDLKREIAFLGDTVNTASRIQEACREHQADLLVSSALLKSLPPLEDEGYRVLSLGKVNLRGKAEPLELFSIEKSRKVP